MHAQVLSSAGHLPLLCEGPVHADGQVDRPPLRWHREGAGLRRLGRRRRRGARPALSPSEHRAVT
ncbi:unnamed protein product [Symbiodinium sp. CCMP2592]|nr:unnamed protein product [Symbiodinium sp. CCMP2592]